MTLSRPLRRVALLITPCFAAAAAACDVIQFVSDPRPTFEETWSIPTSNASISVGSLLPNNVSIFSTPGSNPPDSSAFILSINSTTFSRRVGQDCAPCVTLNGNTTTKPAFVLAAGGASPLPTDVVSAPLAAATVNYSITNNLSFDPIRVRPTSDPNQGFMVILVRSGSVVLGRDSLNGATDSFASGSTITRPIVMNSGTVVGTLQVDLTINSPAGDPAQPGVLINSNGSIATTVAYSAVRMNNVRINVVNKTIANEPVTLDLQGLEESITRRVVAGRLEMTIDNPWPIAGDLGLDFVYNPPASVPKTVPVPSSSATPGPQLRDISFDKTEMQSLLGNKVVLNMSGPVSAPTPVTVSPKQALKISNRMVLTLRTGSGQ